MNGTNTRKRPLPAAEIENDADVLDDILPQHTARKRQKLAEGQDQNDMIADEQSKRATEKVKKKRRTVPQVNVKDVVRERRAAAEGVAKEDEENLHEILEGMTVEQMKSLAVVEDMELPQRETQAKRHNNSENPRWNNEWNGRKNFKKFRRQGEGTQHRRAQRVIVPLEEAKKKGYGIGEEYWVEREAESSSKRRRKEQDRRTQSQSQSQLQTSHIASVPSELITADEINIETIELDAPRTTRYSERTQTDSTGRSGPSQALAEKRDARNQVVNVVPSTRKRKKFAAARDSDDSDDEEESAGRGRFAKRVR